MKLKTFKPSSTPARRSWIATVLTLGLAACSWGAAPTISSISHTQMLEEGTLLIPFTVGDAETPAGTLSMSRSPATSTLFPNATSFSFGGSGANRHVTLRPATNQTGTEAITLIVTDSSNDTASVTFNLTVNAVNDRPTLSNPGLQTLSEDGSKTFSVTVTDVEDSNGSLNVTRNSGNTTLFPANSITISAGSSANTRTVTLTPAANRFDSETVNLVVTDSEGAAATNAFTVTVNAEEDEPTLSNVSSFSTTSISDASTVFPAAQIVDADVIGGENETYHLELTVLSGDEFGEFNGSLSADGTLSSIRDTLRAIQFQPTEGIHPVGVTNQVQFRVELVDYINGSSTVDTTRTLNLTASVYAINEAPEASLSLSPSILDDKTSAALFRATIADNDGSDISVQVTSLSDPSEQVGSFLPASASFTGTSFSVERFIQELEFLPNENVLMSDETNLLFRLTVTDGSGASGTSEATLTLKEVNDPPLISGISSSYVYTDDATPVRPFPAVLVQELDRNNSQQVTVTVTANDPSKGSYDQTGWPAQMTAAEATTRLRSGQFIPDASNIAIGEEEYVTLTLSVTDSAGLERSNSQCTLAITGVNQPPVFQGLPAAMPKRVPPSDPRPFDEMWVLDDDMEDSLAIEITLNGPTNGVLNVPDSISGFTQTEIGTYTFSGTQAAVSNLFDSIEFEVNTAITFPSGAPGATQFTITAQDSLNPPSTIYLDIILLEHPRTIRVTRTEDDFSEGSLRYALAIASPNDVITFALPTYPALLRLSETNSVLSLNKHLSVKGPGADQLTISGDSDGDGTPDLQLFNINATVTLEGLTLDRGIAPQGGAISVQPNGNLTLRSCVIQNSVALQWGGAIDVLEGQLTLERCLVRGNQTDEVFGLGGAAISLYTTQDCRFENTTFSGNIQATAAGYGGGALYIENVDSRIYLDVDLIHCTFAENSDAAGVASSVFCNGGGSRIWPLNSLFSDGQGRNLEVDGAGDVLSLGGNISDDATFSVLTVGGIPNEVYLLDAPTDQRSANTHLDAFDGTGYALLADSQALNAGHFGSTAIDQRGWLRDEQPDSGALEQRASQEIIINEIQPNNAPAAFVELYVPRSAEALDLSGFQLAVDGTNIHTFAASTLVKPGFGIIVANGPLAGVSNVVTSIFQLKSRGELVLQNAAGQTIRQLAYNGDVVDLADPANLAAFPNESLTLAPQFSGVALLPHSLVGTGNASAGADANQRVFGAENAAPVALADQILVGEDELKWLDVLANDTDADGKDIVVVTGVPLLQQGQTARGVPYQVATNEVTLYGNGVWYDPRSITTVQQLAAGDELTDSFRYAVADVGSAAIQDATAVGTQGVEITSSGHRLKNGDTVQLLDTGLYDGAFSVTNVTDDTFQIATPFQESVTDGRWVAQTSRGGASSNGVELTIIGANDFPLAGPDTFATHEEQAIPLMMETDLLVNDSDIDTDDDASTLTIVGILPAIQPIQDITGTTGDEQITITAADHGLSTGQEVLISGYGGFPGYNGLHAVTVTSRHQFTLDIPYVDQATPLGAWALWDAADALQTTTAAGALASLDIRSNRSETQLVYDPTGSSHLNGLALGETETDTFFYVLADSHGALSVGLIDVVVSGRNEAPTHPATPDSLSRLLPFVGPEQTLSDVLGGLHVLDATPAASGQTGRMDVRVQVEGTDETDSLILSNIWLTLEDQPLTLTDEELLSQIADADRTDTHTLFAVETSTNDVPVTLAPDGLSITYQAPASARLDALAHNELLMDSFKLVAADNHSGYVTNDVAVLVMGVNDAPVAMNDALSTVEDAAVAAAPMTYPATNALLWDYDVDVNGTAPDNTLLSFATNGITALGADFVLTNGTFSYNPAPSVYLNGISAASSVVDQVEYSITDQSMLFANDDVFQVQAGESEITLNVLANDRSYNARESSLSILEVSLPDSNGIITTNADSSALIYTPDVNFVGDEIFTYMLTDEWGNQSRGRVVVQVTVEALNGNLQANTDAFTVARGETVELPLLANDNTLPATADSFLLTGLSETNFSDRLTLNGSSVTFEQLRPSGFPYTVSFRYEVSGGGAARAEAWVHVQVVDRTDSLPTQDDFFAVDLNSVNNALNVVANDAILPATGSLTLEDINVAPSHGEVSIDTANNELIYSPDAGYVGTDSFGYQVKDGLGGTGFGTVRVQVGAPVVLDDRFVVPFNSTAIGDEAPVVLDVLANDMMLPNRPVSLRIHSITPSTTSIGHLSVIQNESRLQFSAAEGQLGESTFDYEVRDANGSGTLSYTGSVTVVIEAAGVYANADRYQVAQGASLIELPVLENDLSSLAAGRTLSITALGTGADAPNQGGTLELSENTLLYTPAPTFSGEETFTYTMTDGYASDTARITMQVGAPQMAVNDDAYAVYHEGVNTPEFTLAVLDNDTTLPNSDGQLAIVGLGLNEDAPSQQGALTIAPDGFSLLYTPNTNYTGTSSYEETFTYEVSDGSAHRAAGQVTVSVLLREESLDLSREANADHFSVQPDSSLNELPVLANDGALPSGSQGWNITEVSTPQFEGHISVVGSTIRYTPPPGFMGTDTFRYSISDGFGGTASADVHVQVGSLSLLPDTLTVVSGSISNALDVLLNDGTNLVIQGVATTGTEGSASFSTHEVYYTPTSAYAGSYPYIDHFNYIVLDDSAIASTQQVSVLVVEEDSNRATGTLSITVNGVNDAPLMSGFADLLETDDKTALSPFPVASIADVDEWGAELQTVSIQLDDAAKGVLTNLSGFVATGAGHYTMTGTPAAVTASLRALQFVATENRINAGENETVILAFSLADPFINAPLTHELEIVIWPVNDAPVITGLFSPLSISDSAAVRPFEQALLTEVDERGSQEITARVSLDLAAKGLITPLTAFTQTAPGRYEMSGSAATVNLALQNLQFVPAAQRLSSGQSEVTLCQLDVQDAYVASPVQQLVPITVTGGSAIHTDWRMMHFGTNTLLSMNGANPDHDRFTNIEEYAFGTDPWTTDPDDSHDLDYELNAAAGTITIAYHRRSDDPQLTFTIEQAELLGEWQKSDAQLINQSTEFISTSVVRETVVLALSHSTGFYRVRVDL